MPGPTRLMNGVSQFRFAAGAPNARSMLNQRIAQPQAVMAALYPYMFQDTSFTIDDFTGIQGPNPYLWDSDSDVGQDPWNVDIDSSSCYGGTGNVAGNAISLWGAQYLLPSKNCGVEFRFKLDVVSAFQLECGLANIQTADKTLPIISDIDTPAAVALNTGVMFHIDTSQTLTTAAHVTASAAGATSAKQNLGTFTPVANNWYTVRIGTAFDDSAGYYSRIHVWDTNGSRMTLVASGANDLRVTTDATTALRPWFLIRTRDTVEKVASLDYAAHWMDR